MDVIAEVEKTAEVLSQLESDATAAVAQMPTQPLRDLMADLASQLKHGRAQMVDEYKKTAANIEQRLAAVQAKNEQTRAAISGVKEKMAAAAEAAKAPPATKPPRPIDPALGAKLRDELLARFGLPEVEEHLALSDTRDAWADWEEWSEVKT